MFTYKNMYMNDSTKTKKIKYPKKNNDLWNMFDSEISQTKSSCLEKGVICCLC